MMEDLIGWLLIALVIVLPVLFVYSGIKLYRKHKIKQQQEYELQEQKIKEAKEAWQKKYTGATHVGKTTYDYNADKSRTVVTERATGQQMSYVHTNDSGPDLLTTMIVADMLLKNKESSAGTVSWKDDTPSVSETSSKSSSWGFDDSDSRKSSSSSFSSSDSSSSWSSSDSSSSSSDSGPSSDW
jgi:hypothetical protein